MIVIYIGLIIILGGVGIVVWLMLSERTNSPELKQPAGTPAVKPPTVTPQQILERVGLAEAIAESAPKKKNNSLFSFLKKPITVTAVPMTLSEFTPQVGTKALRLDNPKPDTTSAQNLTVESELSLKIDELHGQITASQEKYARLEELFKEKSESFEKSEKALQAELKARKEFNKVKDLIEKELKDAKDKSRKLEGDLGAAQLTVEASSKRVNQLEEKVKELEKNVLVQNGDLHKFQEEKQKDAAHILELEKKIQDKNQKIEDLVKRMHDLHSVQTPVSVEPTPSEHLPVEETIKTNPIELSTTPIAITAPEPQESPTDDKSEKTGPVPVEPTPKGALKLAPDIFSDPTPQTAQPETGTPPSFEKTDQEKSATT